MAMMTSQATQECEACLLPFRPEKLASHYRRHHSDLEPWTWPKGTYESRKRLGSQLLWTLELDGDIVNASNAVRTLKERMAGRGATWPAEYTVTNLISYLTDERGAISRETFGRRTKTIRLLAKTLPPNPFDGPAAVDQTPQRANRSTLPFIDRLRVALHEAGPDGLSRQQIRRQVAKNAMKAPDMVSALDRLVDEGFAKREFRFDPNDTGSGRTLQVWRVVEPTNEDKAEEPMPPQTPYTFPTNGTGGSAPAQSNGHEVAPLVDWSKVEARDEVPVTATGDGSGEPLPPLDDGLPADYQLPEPPSHDGSPIDILLAASALINQAMVATMQAVTQPTQDGPDTQAFEEIRDRLGAALEHNNTMLRKLKAAEETARAEKYRADGLAKMNRRLEANLAATINSAPLDDRPHNALNRFMQETPKAKG